MGERAREEDSLQVGDSRLHLPFDQYQRYRIVADAVELLRTGADPLRILDVGGGAGVILNFLPEDQVTVLDLLDDEAVPGLIQGDAAALPFDDEAFDYVASVDVYEHIEPESRERYLAELRRTARRGVLLAAPFDSEVVRGAERVANEFHRAVHLIENVWLKEHAENGLPRMEDARAFFEEHGDTVSVLPNGYIPHWLMMICLTFYRSKLEGELSAVFDQANAFYNEFLYGLDNVEPCYRHLLVALKKPVDADLSALTSTSPDSERSSGSTALFGTLSAMLPLAAEAKQTNLYLAQLEQRLTQKLEQRLTQKLEQRLTQKLEQRLTQREGELARKEAQVNDLTRRLAERVSAENSYRAQAERRMGQLHRDYNSLKHRTASVERHRDQLQQQLTGVTGSRAWRLLTVLHRLRSGVGRILGSG